VAIRPSADKSRWVLMNTAVGTLAISRSPAKMQFPHGLGRLEAFAATKKKILFSLPTSCAESRKASSKPNTSRFSKATPL
jgi:hypothetical protein